jgi:hypothetical protein
MRASLFALLNNHYWSDQINEQLVKAFSHMGRNQNTTFVGKPLRKETTWKT